MALNDLFKPLADPGGAHPARDNLDRYYNDMIMDGQPSSKTCLFKKRMGLISQMRNLSVCSHRLQCKKFEFL